MTADAAALVVVVVAYGDPAGVARCLSGLDGRYRVVVVDNGGDERCARLCRQAGATYLNPGANVGFAAGVNRALAALAAGTCDVLLLNPDAVIDPPAVAALHRHLHQPGNERVAAVAPCQHAGDAARPHRIAWPFPSPLGTWADAFGLGRLVRRPQFLIGAVLLLRRRALDEVGPFDERFFLYAEEADWQRRAQLRGWEVRLCEDVVAFHEGGGTSSDHARREALFHSSFELLIRKWYGRPGWASARVGATAGALLRAATRGGEERARAVRQTVLFLKGPHRTAVARQLAPTQPA